MPHAISAAKNRNNSREMAVVERLRLVTVSARILEYCIPAQNSLGAAWQ
jgi:hypothetical protein